MKKLLLPIWLTLGLITTVQGQTIVKGHVVNELGDGVEYVSIGFEDDSVGVISDAKGHFELTIPAGRKKELSFSHVSYLTTEIPYQEYAKGEELTVVLKERVVELTEVVIGKKNKPKTIVGHGVLVPGGVVAISGRGLADGPEGGPTFSCSKSYVISDILLKVSGMSYKQCTLSVNIYEKQGKQFVNIHQKPIYETIKQETGNHTLDIRPEENIVLKPKTDYYLSIAVVDSEGSGYLYIKGGMKNGLYRNAVKGKTKKLPICPAIQVKGYVVEE